MFSKKWLGRDCVLGLILLKVCVHHLNQESPNIFWEGPDSKKLLLYRSFSFCCTYSTSPSRLKTAMGNMKTHDHGCVFIKLYLQKYLQAQRTISAVCTRSGVFYYAVIVSYWSFREMSYAEASSVYLVLPQQVMSVEEIWVH